MRFITKGAPHHKLNARLASHLSELKAGTASKKAWDSFHGKDGTVRACLLEQYGLCAWSEIRLDQWSFGKHLDHINPRAHVPQMTFEHNNLVLSAFDSETLQHIPAEQIFGGHAQLRRNRYSKSGLISPLHPHCRRFIHYRSDGIVEPALRLSDSERRKAKYTIVVLNLNSPLLVNKRKTLLRELEKAIDEQLNDIPSLEQFAELELCMTGQWLRQFHSAVRECFGPLGERVMAKSCPNCA